MSNTVTVACNLPRGMVCELGLELDYAASTFRRTPRYKCVVLRGSQRSSLIALPRGSQFVAQRGLEPGLTENVDLDFIQQWLKEHPRLATHVWVIENKADLKHQVGDRPAPPFEPVDSSKPMKIGTDVVSTATFNEA